MGIAAGVMSGASDFQGVSPPASPSLLGRIESSDECPLGASARNPMFAARAIAEVSHPASYENRTAGIAVVRCFLHRALRLVGHELHDLLNLLPTIG